MASDKKMEGAIVRQINPLIQHVYKQPYCIGYQRVRIEEIPGQTITGQLTAISGSQDTKLRKITSKGLWVVIGTGESACRYGFGSQRSIKKGLYKCVEPKLAAELDKLQKIYGEQVKWDKPFFLLVNPKDGASKRISSCSECKARQIAGGEFCSGRSRSGSPRRFKLQ
jgi:hypothetical protein